MLADEINTHNEVKIIKSNSRQFVKPPLWKQMKPWLLLYSTVGSLLLGTIGLHNLYIFLPVFWGLSSVAGLYVLIISRNVREAFGAIKESQVSSHLNIS